MPADLEAKILRRFHMEGIARMDAERGHMKRERPDPIDPTRIRRIEGGFGWIPHEFIRHEFTEYLGAEEILLYLFLCIVADKNGVSFYGERSVQKHLKFNPEGLERARADLVQKRLILYRGGVYQVLPLPSARPPVSDALFPGGGCTIFPSVQALPAGRSGQPGPRRNWTRQVPGADRDPSRPQRERNAANNALLASSDRPAPEQVRQIIRKILETLDARSSSAK